MQRRWTNNFTTLPFALSTLQGALRKLRKMVALLMEIRYPLACLRTALIPSVLRKMESPTVALTDRWTARARADAGKKAGIALLFAWSSINDVSKMFHILDPFPSTSLGSDLQ